MRNDEILLDHPSSQPESSFMKEEGASTKFYNLENINRLTKQDFTSRQA
jgi:hypothetical protein